MIYEFKGKGIHVDENDQKECHGEEAERWLGFGEMSRKRKGHRGNSRSITKENVKTVQAKQQGAMGVMVKMILELR